MDLIKVNSANWATIFQLSKIGLGISVDTVHWHAKSEYAVGQRHIVGHHYGKVSLLSDVL